jgi:hypothetical protein
VGEAWARFSAGARVSVALTTIHWREAWKYGERHSVTASTTPVTRLRAALLPRHFWAGALIAAAVMVDAQIAAVLGLDRDADFTGLNGKSLSALRR